MSPWTGFKDSDGRDPSLEPDPYLSVHGDIESQICTGFQAGLDTPQEVEDPHFFGPEFNTYHCCFHGHIPERKVVFDMAATGRRFIGCPRNGRRRCQFVIWIDEPWNPVLTRALINLWIMVGQQSTDRPRMDGGCTYNDISLHDSSAERITPEYASQQHVMETRNRSSAARIMSSRTIGFESNLVVDAFSALLTACAALLVVVLCR